MTSLRRKCLQSPVAFQRFLVTFLTIAAMRISLCHMESRVAAHGMGRYASIFWPHTYNDCRKRQRRRPSLCSRFSFSHDSCLRIPRGGANRFVSDDGNESSSSSNNKKSESTLSKNHMPGSKGRHSPVVYQYFGRSRSRGSIDESPLNFILLGPNVDHWKVIGQTLASRGFNVMACERMVEDPPGETTTKAANYEDAPDLVLEILDALKWEKAVLVGCDDESELAMETALMLAPDRVAGLILCGDLKKANQFAEEMGRVRVLDSFLHRYLDCPFVIVWDGGARSIVSGSSTHEAIERKSSPFDGENRCVILGGGSAPHRTKPEYFSWVLARFVEEKLEFHSRPKHRTPLPDSSTEQLDNNNPKQFRARILQNLNLPFGIDSLVSPEGRLLLGRAVAAAIFYTSVMKVAFVQYGILRMGLSSLKNSVDSVDALRRKIFQATGAFIWNLGYIPRLFKFSLKRTKELDEDGIGSSDSATDLPEQEENGESTLDVPSTDFEEDESDDSRKEDEDEDNEDPRSVKIRFLLDNFFA